MKKFKFNYLGLEWDFTLIAVVGYAMTVASCSYLIVIIPMLAVDGSLIGGGWFIFFISLVLDIIAIGLYPNFSEEK